MSPNPNPATTSVFLTLLESGLTDAAESFSFGAVYTADALSNVGNGGLRDGERVLQNPLGSALNLNMPQGVLS